MATLALSTIGTALGGPLGGAIGALIGQSFDKQLLSPPSRGPRLGDLSVQTSSYGTQVPRIYGSMRVAGTVIWATDLVEGEQTTGAKGQPDVTYSYTVSLAVALSSRVGSTVGRIWADGKLLRGSAGDFKVPTGFRFYDGSEGQEIDPLIGSIEGIANTPAYRGLALAVFENLELAAFGNRIPFMTFEVMADAAAPTVASILTDASAGAIVCDSMDIVDGYAAYGPSMAAALEPLITCFDVALFDDGSTVRSPEQTAPIAIAPDELGNSADGQRVARFERKQSPVRTVPSALRLSYYDPARDYQTGEARATAGEQDVNEVQQELAAVLTADSAKSLVEQMLARQWGRRDLITLRLPPGRIALEPGSLIEPGVAPSTWMVEKCTIDGFVAVVELRPSWQQAAAVTGDPGRMVANTDIVQGSMSLALIDVPDVTQSRTSPAILIASSSSTAGWTTRPLTLSACGQTILSRTAARKSILGCALSLLEYSNPYLIDEANCVDVQLVDDQQWLTSCGDDVLAEGANLAVLGSELFQFGNACSLGSGRFRLTHLLRGRGGTEWAAANHAIGDVFCLLDTNSLRSLSLPAWARGTTIEAVDRNGSSISLSYGAESARPLSPTSLSATIDAGGSLVLGWTRRSRSGLAWLDDVDAPLDENREQYEVTVSAPSGNLDLTSDEPALVIGASVLAPLGSGTAVVAVRQLGDWAASRPTQITIELP